MRHTSGVFRAGQVHWMTDDVLQEMWVKVRGKLLIGGARYVRDLDAWLSRLPIDALLIISGSGNQRSPRLNELFNTRSPIHTFPGPAEVIAEREGMRLSAVLVSRTIEEHGTIVTAKYVEGLTNSRDRRATRACEYGRGLSSNGQRLAEFSNRRRPNEGQCRGSGSKARHRAGPRVVRPSINLLRSGRALLAEPFQLFGPPAS